MTIRVMIVDDQAMIRAGLAALLQADGDIEVVGQAENGAVAVAMARELQPDVVLMDVRMPELDGIAATRQLLHHETATRVLMLTTFDIDEYVYEAIRAGASGFLLKDALPAQLIEAVRIIAGGDALLAPSVTRRMIEHFVAAAAPHRVPPSLEHLTEREREILGIVAQGLSNTEIAARLVIAEQTVKTHVSRVLAKLQSRDRAQLVVVAYESGLVRPAS